MGSTAVPAVDFGVSPESVIQHSMASQVSLHWGLAARGVFRAGRPQRRPGRPCSPSLSTPDL